MTASHATAALKTGNAQPLKSAATAYLISCHNEFIEWLFEQAAKCGYHILLVLAGLITEATNWF